MKILVVHASAGAGHMKAAEAIAQALKAQPAHQVVLVDSLDYTSPFFKKLYRGSYSFLVTKIPWMWKFFFSMLDIPSLQPFMRAIRRAYNSFNAKGFHWFLRDEKFDYVISTHFMSVEISSALKKQGLIRSKLICVVTDYDVHRIWLGEAVDQYCVASEWTRHKLEQLGVDPSRIAVTGIPVSEKFLEQHDVVQLKNRLGLTQNAFTVLIATGSFGSGPIEQIIEALGDTQVIIVCGHNQGLYERLNQKRFPTAKILGLVNNMHELMAVSDVMVTKPGGLSISEALVSQLPMIFFNAIPGQEENNVKVLNEHGVGFGNCTILEIVEVINSLKSSKDKFLTALKNTKVLARPSAVKEIIGLLK